MSNIELKRTICGVDEVGRGTLAGPVVASAVILSANHKIEGLKDSKKLTSIKRVKLSKIIQKNALSIGIGIIDATIIDKINIRQATLLAMSNSVKDLSLKPDIVLIDGVDKINIPHPQKNIIGGDSKEDSIMAASIIAKVERDKIMDTYARTYPDFGFEKNKGYGTKFHLNALKINEPTPIHRMTFKPLKNKY
ncbi:MAG: ribonuclease HII [bacterium]